MPVPTLPAWPAGRPLRSWQEEAVAAVLAHPQRSFLASATPAAGKTTFGLNVAHRMLVRAPGRARLRRRADHPHRAPVGRRRRPLRPRPRAQPAQRRRARAARPPRRRRDLPDARRRPGRSTAAAAPSAPTLLIADEPHHMGEQAAWGRSAQAAFEGARFRLLLSGTPFRSDNTPIPWITYDDDGVSRADFAYGYTDALLDGVCRPVTFHTYDGDMEWMSDGRRRRADFSRRPARGRGGAAAAHRARPRGRLDRRRCCATPTPGSTDLRAGPHPEAGGLVVAIDMEHADRLAERLARVTGERPEIVTSETRRARRSGSRASPPASGRWLVSVLMVSEGVDIPRLRVGVYATTRAHRAVLPPGRRALRPPHADAARADEPPLPRLRPAAQAARGRRSRRSATTRSQQQAGGRGGRRAARARRGERGVPRAVVERPPRRRRPADDRARRRAAAVRRRRAAAPPAALAAFTTTRGRAVARQGESRHERRERLRDERRALVAAVSRRTGEAHRAIHGRINRETGARSVAAASVEQLERGNRLLERQAKRREPMTLRGMLPDWPDGTVDGPLHRRRRAARDPGLDRGPLRPGHGPLRARPAPRVARPPARGPALRAHRPRRRASRSPRSARATVVEERRPRRLRPRSTSRRSRTTASRPSSSRAACAGTGPTRTPSARDAEIRARAPRKL